MVVKLTDGEVEALLLQFTVNDSNLISQAEAKIKQLMKSPACVLAFMNQIHGSSNPSARQLAAILLRKKIPTFWKKLNPQHQEQIKATLLQKMIHEEQRAVQNGIAGVVSAIAKCTVPQGKWNDLLTFLLQCSKECNPRFRELGLLLFRVLVETIGSSMKQHFSTLFAIFSSGLNDSGSQTVREESLKALSALFQTVESEEQVEQFKPVVPGICGVIQSSISNGNDNVASHGFELLEEFAESPIPLIDDHFTNIIPFAMGVILENSISMTVRERSCALLTWMIKHQPKKIIHFNFQSQILDTCLNLAVIPFEDDDDDGDDTSNPQSLALEILDELMLHLPNDIIYEPALRGTSQLLQSHNPLHRAAGQLLLFVMAEGCNESMKNNLVQLLEAVCNGMQDPDKKVRANACSALNQFSEHLQPEIHQHHAIVIPYIFRILDNPSEDNEVKARLTMTLDAFCGELKGEAVTPYVEEIMKRLSVLIHIDDKKLQELAIQAVGTIANAAGPGFLPFLNHFVVLMTQVMQITEEDKLGLRAAATRCLGNIASGIGKEAFLPFLNDLVGLSLQGLKLDSCDVREATYHLYSSLADVFGNDLAGILPEVMPSLLHSMDSNDGITAQKQESDADQAFGNIGIEDDNDVNELEEEDEEEEDDNGRTQYSILTGFLDEKMAAIGCVSSFFKNIDSAMLPYVEPLLESLEGLTTYLHENVRILALLSYDDVFKWGIRMWPYEWQQGVLSPIPDNLNKLQDKILPILISGVGIEFEKSVASIAADVLARAIKVLGPSIIPENIEHLFPIITMVIQEETPSQRYALEDAVSTEEDLDELLESICDVISSIAKVMGPSFAQHFQGIVSELIASASRPHRIAGHLASIVGCFGEVTAELGGNVVHFAPQLFPMVFHCMAHSSSIVRRSAAFCLGSMFLSGGAALEAYYQESITLLTAVSQIPENADYHLKAARDNAISAIGKMIEKDSQKLPLAHLFPIFINGLPLTADMAENEYVYPTLLKMISSYPEMVSSFTPQILNAFCYALSCEDVDEPLKVNIAAQMKVMATHFGDQVKQLLDGAYADKRDLIIKFLQ